MTANENLAERKLLKELDEIRTKLNLPEDADARIKEAQRAIATSEKLNRSILDSLDANIAVIDAGGTIANVNDSWIRFALENGVSSLDEVDVGVNYFDVCRAAHGPYSREAPAALEGLQSLLSGEKTHFQLEYPCDSPDTRRWYLMKATRMEVDGRPSIVVSHIDITQRKLAEEAILRSRAVLEAQVQARTRDLAQAKSEAELYLDVMSHDLSNINQALLGYLEVALARLSNEEDRGLITRPRGSV
jgi:hypothetical protein